MTVDDVVENEAGKMGNSPLSVGILGLGEAGLALATDLASMGVDGKGGDPKQHAGGSGISVVAEPEDVASADVVMSVNSAATAISAAASVADVLGPSQAYADLNSGSPAMKQAVARIVEPSGASFVDVALMAAVPGK